MHLLGSMPEALRVGSLSAIPHIPDPVLMDLEAGSGRASNYLTGHAELPYRGGEDKYTRNLQLETRSAL